MRTVMLLTLTVLVAACGGDSEAPDAATPEPAAPDAAETAAVAASATTGAAEKKAYFGDLHVHTMYSFDAFIFGTTASPDDAYEFAKGGVLQHPGGFAMQLREPMDFYGVSDHAFYMGALRAMTEEGSPIYDHELAEGTRAITDEASRRAQFGNILQLIGSDRREEILNRQVFTDAWEDIVAAANRHNDPGKFTTFIAYEYTTSGTAAADNAENLHRNVIFSGSEAPELPFSRIDSRNPEDLWDWMDEQRAAGMDAIAIPHNSNGSNGEMFKLLDWNGMPLDAAYAELRMRNEPLVEISQIKGTSETHPALSPNDEWANFEIMPFRIASQLESKPEGSYVREALKNGIEMESKKGFNPFKFGFIGSSDTHNATYAGGEDNYWSKVGLLDDSGIERASVPLPEPDEEGNDYLESHYRYWSAAGYAGVWAEANTREAIFDAFRRKETFGTSGTRLKVRLFAGYDLPQAEDPDAVAKAYESGVTMGGDLVAEGGASYREPEFLLMALRDANSAALQRLQIVKASVRDGRTIELVYDVACSDGGEVDPETHRCPDNGATVDLETCAITEGKGAASLAALWRDPDFDPTEHAMYYLRVLENPVCRWSTWDAIRAGVAPNPFLPTTIQERAWSSPIWVSPAE